MKRIIYALVFYKKLVVPIAVLSILLGVIVGASTGQFTAKSIKLMYIVFTPFVLFFVYEVRSPNEYYFYYNLGLSKRQLWGSAMLISVIVGYLIGKL